MFWLREGPSIKYVRNCRGVIQNCAKPRAGGGGTPDVYVRTYTISFIVFGKTFAL